MDIFTHFLIPYAVMSALSRPRSERLAAGIGGYAPDLDILWAWVPRVSPELYAFVHRGWSHSAWGGAILAVLLLWILTRPLLTARIPALKVLIFSSGTAAVAIFGSTTHTLFLDVLTITGTPAFWPLTDARLTLNFFFWGVTWALPISLAVLFLRFRRRIGERGVLLGSLGVVAILLLSGGVRASTLPERAEGAVIVPTASDGRWIVAEPVRVGDGLGWDVREVVWGGDRARATYVGNATAVALAAAETCRETGAYKAWRWGGTRAETVNATVIPGGFLILFNDAAARFDYEHGSFEVFGWRPPFGPNTETPYDPEKRGVQCRLVDGVVVETRRPVSFWG